jgi:hypothetical protein
MAGAEAPLIHPSDDLTTHGVIVGMTGSGKTGLGIDLIEEALLDGIPCLVIDPKGDMGNLLLTFPALRPEDFRPWIDPAVEREGTTVEQAAEEAAQAWSEGLSGHGIDPDRIRRLKEGAAFTIYTPGSAAGVGLDVMGSLTRPALDWESDAEVIRDEIQSLVSSLLLLAGIESDPVSGPEHILLSTIIETVWRQGTDLDLATLVGLVPKPPFRKMGVFDVDAFIPAKQRTALAMRLNGLLASPSFASWLEGAPLAIEGMLGGDGKPKAAIVYLSHLTDDERQFFVTLLLSKLVTWIRSQAGTSRLRALVYMDEVFGFAPPTANPPSKKPILTILKQARAHGVGMVLSTQNPVDLDYKAMSNAGSWMVGRLQTENDKKRVLEGLQSASGTVDVAAFDRLISDLEKRTFVLHTTKPGEPVVFTTRWAMSYLAGPLTRDQVSALMGDSKKATPSDPGSPPPPPATPRAEAPVASEETVPVAPSPPVGIGVGFLDPAASWAPRVGAVATGRQMRPAAAATVNLHYDDTAAGVDHRETFEAVILPLAVPVEADAVQVVDHDPRDFVAEPPPSAGFELTEARLDTKAFWTALERDLRRHLVASRPAKVLRHPRLKLYSRIGEPEDEFRQRCLAAAEDAADAAMAKLKLRFAARIDRVRDQITAAEARKEQAEQGASAEQQEELLSGAGDLLGALLGGRSSANPLSRVASRRSQTQRAQAKAETASRQLGTKQQELAALEDELADEIGAITAEYEGMSEQVEETRIGLEADDIDLVELKLVWIPVA